jgi:predicted RNA-binding Zn ribbon-like protein
VDQARRPGVKRIFPERSVLRRGASAVGSVVRAVAELIATDRFSRIRLCANEDCSHALYDGTRSRTQRWHSYEVCGNRANVAAYRARHTT